MRFLDRLRIGDRVFHAVVATVKVGPLLGPERFDDAQRFAQPPDPVIQTLEAVHLVLDLRPGGTDAELEPAARQVIDSHCGLGQQGGIAVSVARHQAADSRSLRRLRHSRLQRPTFEDRPVRPSLAYRGQMVEVPHMVEALVVRQAPDTAQVLDCAVLSRELEPESQRMIHAQNSTSERGSA